MEWTGSDKKKLREALIAIYNTPIKLAKFASDELDRNLNEISTESGLDDRAFELIEEASSGGWIGELYEKFCKVNLHHPRIVQLDKDLQDPAFIGAIVEARIPLERVIGEPNAGNVVARMEAEVPLAEDSRSAHLVVAVFWQERTKQKCRVQPKLCYRDGETREVLQKSLMEDDCSIALKDFPDFLEELVVKHTIGKLASHFSDSPHPWRLTIELFVPVDLLCSPLARWCGQSEDLLRRPIVMGCSDRFNPDQLGRSADLHNQLKLGWQRFQKKVPDQAGLKLQSVDWLNSDMARTKSFMTYSGFQCYGDWLKPDDQYLKNWQELVYSGIPLALWMCEGQPQREEIEATFNSLTDCTRFEFLEQISRIRDEQRKICNHCVGVFYEDPNYVPEIPRTAEKQFFSWPGA